MFCWNTLEPKEDTIAFGDAKIDIPMLDYCAIGVAMGNGGAEILAMADMVTDDVEHDGLYNAFEKLGLLENRRGNMIGFVAACLTTFGFCHRSYR